MVLEVGQDLVVSQETRESNIEHRAIHVPRGKSNQQSCSQSSWCLDIFGLVSILFLSLILLWLLFSVVTRCHKLCHPISGPSLGHRNAARLSSKLHDLHSLGHGNHPLHNRFHDLDDLHDSIVYTVCIQSYMTLTWLSSCEMPFNGLAMTLHPMEFLSINMDRYGVFFGFFPMVF